MKKFLAAFLFVLFVTALVSSCGSRRDRCPGVGLIENQNSIPS